MLRSNVKAEAGALKSYAKTGVVVQRLAPAFVPQGVRVNALAATSRAVSICFMLVDAQISAFPLAQNAMFRVPCRLMGSTARRKTARREAG